MDVH
jgi:hypothetical protein